MDTNLKNSDDLEKRNVANENIVRENIVKKSHNWKIMGIIAMILTVLLLRVPQWGYIPIWKRKRRSSAAETADRKQKQQGNLGKSRLPR